MQDGRVGPWQTKATAMYMITSSTSIKRNLQGTNTVRYRISFSGNLYSISLILDITNVELGMIKSTSVAIV